MDLLSSFASEEHRVRNVRARRALETVRAIDAEARGDHRDAATRYGDAAAGWLAYGSIPMRAETLFGQGRALLALDDAGAATALHEARAMFEDLGAVLSVEDVDRVLGEDVADVAVRG